MTGSEVFPLQFCGHRWLEDKRVAERVVEMWPSLKTCITEILKKPKSQVPTSSSFSTVKSVLNKWTAAKLELFMSIAAAMRPYLQTFQSDGPLLPFITSPLTTCRLHDPTSSKFGYVSFEFLSSTIKSSIFQLTFGPSIDT